MSIYTLKPKSQDLLRPIVKQLYQKGTTANQITLFACAASILISLLLALFADVSTLLWLLPIWLFVRMALNAMDGVLAQEFGQQSALGGYLNEAANIVADAALYLPFAFTAPFDGVQIALFIWLAVMTELCGVLGQIRSNGRRYDGPFGRSSRAFFIGALTIWYTVAGSLHSLFYILTWLVCAASVYTCYKRVINGLKAI